MRPIYVFAVLGFLQIMRICRLVFVHFVLMHKVNITVAQQVDGHPEVVLKSGPSPAAGLVDRIPSGHTVTVLSDDGGDYIRVRWVGQEGFVRRANVIEVALCQTSCCTRPTESGFLTCCRTCGDSIGKHHGPQCEAKQRGRDAAGVEVTSDQLVKVARDMSADIMKNAPVAADIDKYTKPDSIWQILEHDPPDEAPVVLLRGHWVVELASSARKQLPRRQDYQLRCKPQSHFSEPFFDCIQKSVSIRKKVFAYIGSCWQGG